MKIVSKLRYLKIAPRKVRLIADLIRGKKVERAQTVLNFTPKRASLPLMKLLNQSLSNAKNNFQLDPVNLYISKITVDEGPKYKRWRARARGRADQIQKKTSHVTLILDETVKKAKKVKRTKPKIVSEEKVSKRVAKPEESKKETRVSKRKVRLRPEKEMAKPKTEKGLKRLFRRKAF
jgi:large subunit ribosomal protein L22